MKEKSKQQQHGEEQRKRIAELYAKHAGKVPDIARAMGLARSTVWEHLQKLGIKKPLAGGKQRAAEIKEPLPISGSVKRYILTSALSQAEQTGYLRASAQPLRRRAAKK